MSVIPPLGLDEAQGGSLKVAVYLLSGLYYSTWLLVKHFFTAMQFLKILEPDCPDKKGSIVPDFSIREPMF